MKKRVSFAMIVIAAVAAGIGYRKLTGEESIHYVRLSLRNVCPISSKIKILRHVRKSKPNAGYVVLKDLNGPLQYLLMPTYRINGTGKSFVDRSFNAELLYWPGRRVIL